MHRKNTARDRMCVQQLNASWSALLAPVPHQGVLTVRVLRLRQLVAGSNTGAARGVDPFVELLLLVGPGGGGGGLSSIAACAVLCPVLSCPALSCPVLAPFRAVGHDCLSATAAPLLA